MLRHFLGASPRVRAFGPTTRARPFSCSSRSSAASDAINLPSEPSVFQGETNPAQWLVPSPAVAPITTTTTASAAVASSAGDLPYLGLGGKPFSDQIAKGLQAPIKEDDIEIKPDGIIYLPEIKYRRILNTTFGPGGWGLMPIGHSCIRGQRTLSREYGLVADSRLIAIARGENDFMDPSGLATAAEGVKSNALMRCCKDIGIASELWDPIFIRNWLSEYAVEVAATHIMTKQYRRVWRRKEDKLKYPWEEKK